MPGFDGFFGILAVLAVVRADVGDDPWRFEGEHDVSFLAWLRKWSIDDGCKGMDEFGPFFIEDPKAGAAFSAEVTLAA